MRNMTKRVLAFCLVLAMAAAVFGGAQEKVNAATSPKLSKKTLCVTKGGSKTLTLKDKPSGARVSYSSANKAVATVSNSGTVKGIKAGATKITCTVKAGGKTYNLTCRAIVSAKDTTGYKPKHFSWQREGTEGYASKYHAVGKYVRADGKAVLYIGEYDTGESFVYELYVKAKGSRKSYVVPAKGASEEFAWCNIENDQKDAYDWFYKVDLYDKGGHVIKVSVVWDDYMRENYADPSGTYHLARMK